MWRALGLFLICQVVLAGVLGRCAHAQKPRVVFIAPTGLAPDTNTTLEEAIATQVSMVGAELVFLIAGSEDAGLEDRMREAEDLAQRHQAAGVFWIDARPSGRWFLYIMDHNGAHVVVRPLSVEGSSVDAAIEAAAVIAGSATDALLNQRSIDGELVTPRRKPEPVPESELRLEAGYARTLFSPGRWIDGASVGGSWLWPSGPYVGVLYVWSPPIRFVDEAEFEVTRHPIWVHGGARVRALTGLEVGVELAAGIEVRERTATISVLETSPAQTRTVWMTAIRLAVEWRLLDWLAILGRASPELALNTFDYVKFIEVQRQSYVYLSPYKLRFTALLGIAILR